MDAFPDTISGFSVLPAIYLKDAIHILYGKVHTSSSKKAATATAQEDKAAAAVLAADVLPRDRTLFLVNVPPDATQRELALFFKPDGLVEKVVFDQRAAEEEALNALNALNAVDESDGDGDSDEEEQEEGDGEGMEVDSEHPRPAKRPKKGKEKEKNDNERRPLVAPLPSTALRTLRHTGRTAFLVFLDASSLTTALSPPHPARPWPQAAPQSAEPRGLAHYKALHSALRPPLPAVRAHAESAIALFDYEERQRRRNASGRYRKGEALVDEDGFTLVARGGAYGQTLGGGVGVASKRFRDSGETSSRARGKKKGGAEKEGFYAFQKHEKKRQELIELKKKWKEDLEKVEKLKETKRYKPY